MFSSILVTPRRVSSQLHKYNQILADEGWSGVFWCINDFAKKVRKAVFSIEKFFLYEMILDNVKQLEARNLKVSELTVRPIFLPISLREYEYLGNENVDFETLSNAAIYNNQTDKGTIVFLSYLGDKLMNRTGITLYRNGAYIYNYPENLGKGETAYAGFSETTKSARKMGIYSFVHSYIYKYLKNCGFKRVILLESVEQVGPRKVQDRLGAVIISVTYCIRLLGVFNYWITRRIQRP